MKEVKISIPQLSDIKGAAKNGIGGIRKGGTYVSTIIGGILMKVGSKMISCKQCDQTSYGPKCDDCLQAAPPDAVQNSKKGENK